MSKPITGAAFMMLVDEGKVNLDDPVEKYLPEFKGRMVVAERDRDHILLTRPKHPITVRNILSHTSGLGFRTPIEQPTLDILPLSARVRGYAMMPLEFEPDTKYQYSNAGINTAGRIIEVVSGLSYADFLDQRLFKPLGMVDTTFWPTKEQIARIATSYKTDGAGKLEATTVAQLQYPLDGPGREPMPAGGLFSTAVDIGVFCRMVFNGGELNGRRYLSPEAVKQMTSLQTGELPNGYGLGWSVDKPPKTTFGHGGAYATNMRIDPQRGIITVFMVQYAGAKNDRWKQVLPTFMDAASSAFGTQE
jgi:CubicO group peptidase (beta-lactamase class C family)